jgi:arylesterase/paraoxonase
LLEFAAYAKGKKEKSPSEIIKIDYRGKNDYQIEQMYMEDGTEMSASTVAATFGNLIFVGNVMDEHFLILEQNTH